MTAYCVLKKKIGCNNLKPRTYFVGTPQEFSVCRDCATKLAITMILASCEDGNDIEIVFRDIMHTMSQQAQEEADTDSESDDS